MTYLAWISTVFMMICAAAVVTVCMDFNEDKSKK